MNPKLAKFAIETARREGIPHQVTVRSSGGTDAGSFTLANEGIPSVVLGTPARYIHSHNAIFCLSYFLSMVAVSLAMVNHLDDDTVKSFTSFI